MNSVKNYVAVKYQHISIPMKVPQYGLLKHHGIVIQTHENPMEAKIIHFNKKSNVNVITLKEFIGKHSYLFVYNHPETELNNELLIQENINNAMISGIVWSFKFNCEDFTTWILLKEKNTYINQKKINIFKLMFFINLEIIFPNWIDINKRFTICDENPKTIYRVKELRKLTKIQTVIIVIACCFIGLYYWTHVSAMIVLAIIFGSLGALSIIDSCFGFSRIWQKCKCCEVAEPH
ncbi:MAG: hypothetical protein Harvfovirus15_26 [Harvfovirus sp.]|uniref:Uncharacterized protein n=1 Tax=Harvfovirus sp. TaxID=2487768 RepID=A0A3G5A1K9_9VIRU|nr:MAG: hypothetical protein Harvfovirus15_26 [Harvfovirus sp.]